MSSIIFFFFPPIFIMEQQTITSVRNLHMINELYILQNGVQFLGSVFCWFCFFQTTTTTMSNNTKTTAATTAAGTAATTKLQVSYPEFYEFTVVRNGSNVSSKGIFNSYAAALKELKRYEQELKIMSRSWLGDDDDDDDDYGVDQYETIERDDYYEQFLILGYGQASYMLSVDKAPIEALKVPQLKEALKARGLSIVGKVPELRERLKEFEDKRKEAEKNEENKSEPAVSAAAASASTPSTASSASASASSEPATKKIKLTV